MPDKSAILTRAWEIYNKCYSQYPVRAAFHQALKTAWYDVKLDAMLAERAAKETPQAKSLRERIYVLENKDHWTTADHECHSRLAALLREAA